MPIINIIFVRDPKQCYALFDPRFARISTNAQDDTDENRKVKPKRELLSIAFFLVHQIHTAQPSRSSILGKNLKIIIDFLYFYGIIKG